MAVSKAQQKAVTKYVKSKYDRFGLTMPKGNLDSIKAHAESRSESVNGFIGRAIAETMERDSGETPSARPQEALESSQGAGTVSLPSEAIKTAREAAEAAGEAIPQFIARAISETAEREKEISK